MWFVIKLFTDLQDKDHLYNEGDPFPREGLEVSEERIKELSSSNNLQGTPLIENKEMKTDAIMEAKPKKRGRPKKKE
jgi:hypothetical protein